MTEVYINNERLDLKLGNVSQTFQINDIGNLDTRQTSYTNKFKVPKTPRNVKIFDALSLVGKVYEADINSGKFPYGTPMARIIEDGIEILSNGYAIVSDSTEDEYAITVYGSEKTFFEKLKEYTIQDIFPDTIINYTASNFSNYVSRNDVFVFSLVNFNEEVRGMGSLIAGGNNAPPAYIELWTERITPQFFAKDIFQFIFDFLGYNVVHDLGSNSDFKNLLQAASKGVSSFEINYGDDFNLKEVAPTMELNTFVSEIMYRFGLLVKVDERNKTVYFKNINDLLLGTNRTNWSDKFHAFKKEIYKLSNYAQTNIFKYSKDEDQYPDLRDDWQSFAFEDELQGEFEIQNANLGKETTHINSKFVKPKYANWRETNTHSYGRFFYPTAGGGYTAYYLLDLNEYQTNEQGNITEFTESFDYQLFYRKKITRSLRYKMRLPNGDFETISKGSFYICTYIETNFQYYINQYYSSFVDLLNHIQVITAVFNINPVDIYNLDFFKKVYVKQLGGEFYLNKVKNFKQGKLTEVELVKIPPNIYELSYYNQFSEMIGTP
jgi:hypothetical protein